MGVVILEKTINQYRDVDNWKTMIFLYNAALKEVGTKLEILNDEFQHVHRYNPIEHIKTRVKSPESIVKKLKRNGFEPTIENITQPTTIHVPNIYIHLLSLNCFTQPIIPAPMINMLHTRNPVFELLRL